MLSKILDQLFRNCPAGYAPVHRLFFNVAVRFLFNRVILRCLGQEGLVSYTIIAYVNTLIVNTMLGVSLPYVTIPVRPGRNLAGIVEIAAMKNRQAFFGYNSAQEFVDRVDRQIDELSRQAARKTDN